MTEVTPSSPRAQPAIIESIETQLYAIHNLQNTSTALEIFKDVSEKLKQPHSEEKIAKILTRCRQKLEETTAPASFFDKMSIKKELKKIENTVLAQVVLVEVGKKGSKVKHIPQLDGSLHYEIDFQGRVATIVKDKKGSITGTVTVLNQKDPHGSKIKKILTKESAEDIFYNLPQQVNPIQKALNIPVQNEKELDLLQSTSKVLKDSFNKVYQHFVNGKFKLTKQDAGSGVIGTPPWERAIFPIKGQNDYISFGQEEGKPFKVIISDGTLRIRLPEGEAAELFSIAYPKPEDIMRTVKEKFIELDKAKKLSLEKDNEQGILFKLETDEGRLWGLRKNPTDERQYEIVQLNDRDEIVYEANPDPKKKIIYPTLDTAIIGKIVSKYQQDKAK